MTSTKGVWYTCHGAATVATTIEEGRQSSEFVYRMADPSQSTFCQSSEITIARGGCQWFDFEIHREDHHPSAIITYEVAAVVKMLSRGIVHLIEPTLPSGKRFLVIFFNSISYMNLHSN